MKLLSTAYLLLLLSISAQASTIARGYTQILRFPAAYEVLSVGSVHNPLETACTVIFEPGTGKDEILLPSILIYLGNSTSIAELRDATVMQMNTVQASCGVHFEADPLVEGGMFTESMSSGANANTYGPYSNAWSQPFRLTPMAGGKD